MGQYGTYTMLLKNKSPRLISINASANPEDRIDLMPAGEAVDVPDKLCESRYVKALLQSGSVEEVGESKSTDDELAGLTVAELKAYADGLEIEYGASIKKEDLKALIETHQEDA